MCNFKKSYIKHIILCEPYLYIIIAHAMLTERTTFSKLFSPIALDELPDDDALPHIWQLGSFPDDLVSSDSESTHSSVVHSSIQIQLSTT